MVPSGLARALAAALLSCAAAGAAGAGCAPASTPQHFVRGAGRVSDDWTDEGLLSADHHARSDLAGMWQAVLWADGYLARRQVDCRFGAATDRATRNWQSNHALNTDGIVGPQTFAAAGKRLTADRGLVVYRGERSDLPFRRGRDGRYYAEDAGHYVPLSKDAPTLRVCR